MHYPRPVRLPPDAYENRDAVFHIVMNALVGEAPFEYGPVANAVWEVILREQERGDVRIAAACLMPNHLHVIVSPDGKSLIRWINDFKSFTTHLTRDLRGRRFLWRRGFYDRRLREPEVQVAIEYVLRNPLTAGLVHDAMDWPWVGAWEG